MWVCSLKLILLSHVGSGIAVNAMCVNESFCVTGSDDGFLRLWPLDFKTVFLEAGEIAFNKSIRFFFGGVQYISIFLNSFLWGGKEVERKQTKKPNRQSGTFSTLMSESPICKAHYEFLLWKH